jgi:hypothetical protein
MEERLEAEREKGADERTPLRLMQLSLFYSFAKSKIRVEYNTLGILQFNFKRIPLFLVSLTELSNFLHPFL